MSIIRLIILIIIVWGIHFWWSLFTEQQLDDSVSLTITPGWSVEKILSELKEKNLIKSVFESKIYLTLFDIGPSLQAGEYQFSGTISPKDVLNHLSSGSEQERETMLTFIEGWTIEEMADYVAGKDELTISHKDFLRTSPGSYPYTSHNTYKNIPGDRNFEGYLFPDTYRVFKNITAEELVAKMLDNFAKKFTKKFMDALTGQGRTVDEAIILASILERELASFEDKELAADVFLKRLSQGMALQADSTINYITGKKTTRASAEDLKIDSPYNTYKYRGLPPGPISNPGLESIEAAVFPKSNDYYYFLTTPEGEAIFSRTLKEHNEQKNKYY